MTFTTSASEAPFARACAAVLFSMRNLPLLEQGTTTYDPPATAENLWLSIKENGKRLTYDNAVDLFGIKLD